MYTYIYIYIYIYMDIYTNIYLYIYLYISPFVLDGYCSTVQGLLDWLGGRLRVHRACVYSD